MRTAKVARSTIVVALFVMIVALTGGCVPHVDAEPGAPGPGTPAPDALDASCDSPYDSTWSAPPTTVLPADAVLVSVKRCVSETRPVRGDGEWLVAIHQEATSHLDALADALRLPTVQPPLFGGACPAIAYAPIVLQATDTAGRTIYPYIPLDACGVPLLAVTDAIDALPWTDVSTTKIRRVQSDLAVTSGCSDQWKPMIGLTADDNGTRVTALDPAPAGRPLRVCHYDLDTDPANAMPGANGTMYRVGILVGASTMDAAAGGEFLAAVASAPKATACAQPEAPFAVVFPPEEPGATVTVERGGCHRVLVDGESALRQLDGALVDRLIG